MGMQGDGELEVIIYELEVIRRGEVGGIVDGEGY